MIILNENEWAAAQLNERDLGDHPSDTMRMIARYYIDSGMECGEVRRKMDEFLLRCVPTAILPQWCQTLDKAYQRAAKYPAVDIDSIPITQAELNTIASLSGVQVKRLAFTLLCLAKYWVMRNADCDYWVCTEDREIMCMANIKTSLKRQCLMYHELKELGFVRLPRKVDGKNVRVCFADPEGKPVIRITDFRNLGFQYLQYLGEPFFACESCGIVTKIDNPKCGRKQKYCSDCAVKIKIRKTVEAAMQKRVLPENGKNVKNVEKTTI